MNTLTQTRLLACGVLLLCCLVTAVFNRMFVTSIINIITFLVAFGTLSLELKKAQRGMYVGREAEKPSIAMLGSALIVGASLVGGIMYTDIMDGISMYVDIHGQTFKAEHQHGGSLFFCLLSYLSWLISLMVFIGSSACMPYRKSEQN